MFSPGHLCGQQLEEAEFNFAFCITHFQDLFFLFSKVNSLQPSGTWGNLQVEQIDITKRPQRALGLCEIEGKYAVFLTSHNGVVICLSAVFKIT